APGPADPGGALDRAWERWAPPLAWRRIRVVDAHTGGEPLRVICGGVPTLPGDDVLARRRWAERHLDDLRRALMWEPRGHADMYGCLVMPPVTERAAVSVLFLHNEGFSTMCGHGIIALATVLVETGALGPPWTAERTHEGALPPIGIDTPAGFVEAVPVVESGRVEHVSFRNVPSFAAALGRTAEVPGYGTVPYDLAFGGAFYAYVDAGALELSLEPRAVESVIAAGRAVKAAVQAHDPPRHPEEPDLGFLYGVIFSGPPPGGDCDLRNVCVFADGEVDRSPTGTGVSGRLAIEHARGRLRGGETLVVESLVGSRFTVRSLGRTRVGGVRHRTPHAHSEQEPRRARCPSHDP
ncbi:MAG: hypothetical protein D6701_11910, partial [Gemmatimonadetes bacterium]